MARDEERKKKKKKKAKKVAKCESSVQYTLGVGLVSSNQTKRM